MQTLLLEAFDTLFFRDGRPFTMGEDTAATGPFPPNPGVAYGAIRAAVAVEEGIPKDLIVQNTSDINLLDYGLLIGNIRYYPAPLDIFIPKDSKHEIGFHAQLIKAEDKYMASGMAKPGWWFYASEAVQQVKGYFISEVEFKKYLSIDQENAIGEYKLISLNIPEMIELKTGIARTGFTRITTPGHLYRIGMVRPICELNHKRESIKIIVSYKSQKDRKNTTIAKLGGEAKLIHIKNYESNPNLPLPNKQAAYFKIYLKTAAFFDQNCFPNLEKYVDCELQPIAWAIGKAQRIGGFDMKERVPKTMRSAVPAGSVYYYKLPQDLNFEKLREKLKSISSISDHRAEEGFGLYEFGALPFAKLQSHGH